MMILRVRQHLRHRLLLLAALMFVVSAVLEAGIIPHTVYKSGPFAEDSSGMFLNVPVPESFLGSWWVGARYDRLDAAFASSAKLWINHIAYDKPHSPHQVIASGRPGSYSHWYGQIYFALPPGVPNDASTVLRIEYPLQWRYTWAGYALMATGGLALLLLLWRATWSGPIATVLELPSRLLLWLGYGMAAILAFYVLGSLWALSTGSALPTAAMLRQNRSLEWLARTEWTLPYVVMSLALLAAAFDKISGFFGPATVRTLKLCRTSCERMLHRLDVPLLIGWSIVSVSVIWTGYPRPANAQFSAILGLIPFSDAQGYYSGVNSQATHGQWQGVLLNRPLASAARTALAFCSAYSYQLMVLLQAVLFGLAAALSGRAVARWLGLWSALVFVSFACIVGRPFLTTALTETIGLLLALTATPFLVGALRYQSQQLALITLTIIALALMVRMGSMLLVPAIGAWIVLAFSKRWQDGLRLTVQVALCILYVVVLNSAVQWFYSSKAIAAAGNFAYSLCGLSVGGDWSACMKRYSTELASITDYGEKIDFFYAKALENIANDPLPIIARLQSGILGFGSAVPAVMMLGYVYAPLPAWWPKGAVFFVLFALGVVHALSSRKKERWFWAFTLVSVLASSAFVFFDDGLRVMIVSYPFIALFLSAGLNTGVKSGVSGCEQLALKGAAFIGIVSFVLLVTPGFAHWVMVARPDVSISEAGDKRVIMGGRRISGVLVVSDGTATTDNVPTMQLADFVTLVKQSGVEYFQGLVTPEIPSPPFGFITAPPGSTLSGGPNIYIVPPEVVERDDVPYWTLTLREWHPKPDWGPYWHRAISAAPLYPAPQR